VEAIGEGIVAILGASDFDISIADKSRSHGGDGRSVVIEGHVQADGEDARSEAGDTAHLLLGDGHALDGEQLLRVDGLVEGDEVGSEIGNLVEVFELDDGEGGCCEAVSAGVLAGASLALGSARASALGRVGSVRGELLIGSSHKKSDPLDSQIARESE
jgi:hypothetical protein